MADSHPGTTIQILLFGMNEGTVLNCSIKGCKESCSEILEPRKAARWYVFKPEEWPNIPDYIGPSDVFTPFLKEGFHSGPIILCPQHRKEVYNEVARIYDHHSPTGRSEDVN
jgi:hypothetical protein